MNQRVRYLGVAIAGIGLILAFTIPLTNWDITAIAVLIIGGVIVADYPYIEK